ncbi:Inherit from COG: Methyltransferase [Seminavis robusta]|uniref:Inherit from COG: Methyltransferase n=1 Tax=Seminavis robusta TaxID=568900 RepID=A0A9N8EBS7_9STRA|nr:Inherit from COG: Methyltransferase [Seminavis robusta]|eukprot:Sro854_g211280.1 Inherit from COG: Methyltransferase (271) ;mRNA; f:36873-37685
MHDGKFDTTNWAIMQKGNFAQSFLTASLAQILHESPPGIRVIDVGGDIGFFTLLAASLGPVAIDVFEPQPVHRLRICESLNINQWHSEFDMHYDDNPKEASLVNVIPFGVGNARGLYEFKGELGHPNQGHYTGLVAKMGSNAQRLVQLDEFAEERGWFGESRPDIAILKVSVEGFELNTVEGALELLHLKVIRNILIEVSFRNEAEIARNRGTVQILEDSEYRLYKMGTLEAPDELPIVDDDKLYENLVKAGQATPSKQLNLWWKLSEYM